MRRMTLSETERSELVSLYRQGASQAKVARVLGVSPTTVRKWLARYGVASRPQHVTKRLIKDLTETDKAYLAGLLDGEGWMGIYSAPYPRPRLVIGNTDRKMLAWLKGIGGSVRASKSRGKRKPFYVWDPNSYLDIEYILESTIPYLTTKRDQAVVVLEFIQERLKEWD